MNANRCGAMLTLIRRIVTHACLTDAERQASLAVVDAVEALGAINPDLAAAWLTPGAWPIGSDVCARCGRTREQHEAA